MLVAIPTFNLAFWYLVCPHADARLAVICQSRRALIATGFAVPAVPEHIALCLVSEDTVQTGTVGRADGRLWKDNRRHDQTGS